MNVAERERELARVVEEYRETECARLREAAERESQRLRVEAWREARRRLHRVVGEERERASARIRDAEAALATRRRMHQQRASLALLTEAWEGLRSALAARWRDPATRARWVERALSEALKSLPAGRWTLRHPSDWAPSERSELAARIESRHGAPQLLADSAVAAGLIFESGPARLDASLTGLLEDRQAVEARLLALMTRRAPR